MNQNKKWCFGFLSIFLLILSCLGLFTVIVDPYFHYHKPLKALEYPIDNQRYQNDGIIKNFDYNAMIIGSSLVENFKTSQLDAQFGVSSIKVPFPSGTYKEVNDNLERAVSANPDLQLVIRGLDFRMLLYPKDTMHYSQDAYPTYLYDKNIFNDVNYIFNKEILQQSASVLDYTRAGNTTTDFDSYSSTVDGYSYGKAAVDAGYHRAEKSEVLVELMEADLTNLQENLQQNVIDLAVSNPDIDFYLFFPPSSIYLFDNMNQAGELEKQLQAHKYAIELLLPYENIYLFSFFDEYHLICNLDNYRDSVHYNDEVTSQILLWMKNGEHLLTEENYQEYYQNIHKFYSEYDYEGLFIE